MVFLFVAGDEALTRYLDLGNVALYQMSYARRRHHYCSAYGASGRGRTGDTRIFSPLLYQLSYLTICACLSRRIRSSKRKIVFYGKWQSVSIAFFKVSKLL